VYERTTRRANETFLVEVKIMPNANEILSDSEIAAFLKTHQGAAKEIERAAEILANKTDAIAALKKLLPALGEKVVHVFFSYKQKDELAATAVVDILRTNSAEKLDIAYQAAFTEKIAGKLWRQEIHTAVDNANWFVLLLPDPSDDWDWPLYEAGLFEGKFTSGDRLICLHHPGIKIPSQIEGYHAVATSDSQVEDFLRMVYVNEDPIPGMKPLNKSIESKIPALAKQIVEAIRPPKKPFFREIFEPWVELKIEGANLEMKEELDHAQIISANRPALDVFDRLKTPSDWGELRQGVLERAGDGRWREDLFHVIRKIANDRKFDPVQAVFQTHSGKMYRPVAYAVDRSGEDGPIETYHITFTEEIGAVDVSVMPKELSALASLLRLTFRFRWEILEKYRSANMTEGDVERLGSALRRIESDLQSRGENLDQATIESLFPPEKATRIHEMFAEWHKVRNPEGTGELDIAIEEKDARSIPGILERFTPMNQEFLEMGADRFSEMVSGTS
jgi:hypothetical protein